MAKAARIKVRVTWTIDVDVQGWADEYGVDATLAAVRKDVQTYALDQLQSSTAGESGLLEVRA